MGHYFIMFITIFLKVNNLRCCSIIITNQQRQQDRTESTYAYVTHVSCTKVCISYYYYCYLLMLEPTIYR